MDTEVRYKARIGMGLLCLMTNTCAFSTIKTTSSSRTNTAFAFPRILHTAHHHRTFHKNAPLFLRAPPGSGYMSDEDEQSFFPDTYEPMMEYPGTMRPGRTPENQPFSSLPIQESDPDPVPWPHFQEIEWHHNWGSPHEHPIPMEDFIEMQGRWASAEMEAEIRAGARRGVRERREMEESQSAASFILDDDDDDDDDDDEIKLDLGEGVEAFIGTDKKKTKAAVIEDDDEDDDRDNFLLDLGLDGGDDIPLDEDEDDVEEEEPAFVSRDGSKDILEAMQSMIDADDSEIDESDDTDIDLNFDDLDLDFGDVEEGDDSEIGEGDDEEDEDFMMDDFDMDEEEEDMMPLDEMIGNEDMGEEDEFDDGGFDYD